MSSEIQVRQRMQELAERLQSSTPAEVERALAGVRSSAERRQKLQLFVLAGAAAAIALVVANTSNIAELFSIEDLLPQPAEEQNDEGRADESDRRAAPDDIRRSTELDSIGTDPFNSLRQGGARIPGGRSQDSLGGRLSGPGSEQGKDSEKKTRHTERKPYRVVDTVSSSSACWAANQCPGYVVFRPEPGDRWVSIRIEDSAGQDVWAEISVGPAQDGRPSGGSRICTATESPIRIRRGYEVHVWVRGSGCPNGEDVVGGPTAGEIVATFFS